MKLKKIMLITLLLFAILTVGAVSASEDADNITAADEMETIDSPGDECEVIASDSADEVVAQDENKKNVTINADLPEEVYYGQYVGFDVYITPEDDEWDYYPEGDIIFYVNDEEIETEYGEYGWFEYAFEEFGTYNFKLEYTGDEYFNPSEKIITYNLTNSMYKISVDDEIDFLENTFRVYSPVENPGEIVITINGKKFNVFYEEEADYSYCNVSALNYGLNTVNIYYPGDDYFAEYSADKNITLYSRVKHDDELYEWGEEVEFYVEVPGNATGTLKVYSVGYDEEYDAIFTEIGSANVNNGVARVILNDLPVGEQEIYANFTGSVDVRSVDEYVHIYPKLTVPKTILTGEDANVIAEADENAKGEIKVTYIDYDVYGDVDFDDYEFLASANIADGEAKIPLSGLKEGHYTIRVSDDLYFSRTYSLYVVDKYDVALNITYSPENIIINSEYNYIDFETADYADGNITLYIDGKAVETISSQDGENSFIFNSTGLDLGEHTLTINFTSETQGISCDSVKFNVVAATIFIPNKVTVNSGHASGNDVELGVNDNAKGTVTILIDNDEYLSESIDAIADEHSYFVYNLDGISLKKHNVTVIYADDKYGIVRANKTVNFGYEILIHADCRYGEDNIIEINLPNNLGNGDLTVTLNGNKLDYVRNSSQIIINPSKLSLAYHTVEVKYGGDDFYPAENFNETFEIYTEITGPDGDFLIGSQKGITLLLPDDAKGKLNVSVKMECEDEDGYWDYVIYDTQLVSFENGKAYYSLAGLPIGEYVVEASYTGNDYDIDSNGFYLEVNSIDWGNYYLKLGEDKTITFISEDENPGQLRVVLSRYVDYSKEWDDSVNVVETLTLPIVDGKVSHTFTNLKIGDYHIFVAEEFVDGSFKGFQAGKEFYVEMPYIEIKGSKFAVGNITPVKINFPADADGKIIVKVSNYTEGKSDLYNSKEFTVDGITVIDLNEIIADEGRFTVSFNYTGNYGEFYDNYYYFTITGQSKLTADIDVNVTENVNFGDDVVLNINTTESDSSNVTVTIDEVNYKTSVASGKSTVAIPNLKSGSYEAIITFEGDSKYMKNTKVVSFTVNKVNSTLTVGDIECEYGTAGTADVTFSGASEIQAAIEGVLGANITVGDGKITVYGLNPGTYTLAVTTIADDNHNPVTKKAKVTVLRKQTTMNVTCNETIKKGSTLTINVELGDDASGNILVSIGNMNLTASLENGKTSIQIPDLAVGKYSAVIAFTGNEVYNPITQTKDVSVVVDPAINAKNTNVVYAANGKYTVTVYGTDGNLAKNTQVIFKIAGKQVAKVNTNDKGVATYTVKNVPGKYKISATALGKTDTKTLTVKHLVTLKSATVKKSAKKLVLTATLAKVNKKYLKNKKITFKFNGKKYTAKTNSKGVAKVTIKSSVLKKLKVGKKITYQATYVKDTVKKTAKVKK